MLHKTSPEIGGMGHSVKRKEDLRFVQGKGTYVEDVRLPGMVYGQMVRSPYAHARINRAGPRKSWAVLDANAFP
jgi:carbon-monoxide dehydrogenase large subunit